MMYIVYKKKEQLIITLFESNGYICNRWLL